MSPRLLIPLAVPLLLFSLGLVLDGVITRSQDLHRLERQRQHSQLRLEDLQAQAVAAREDARTYQGLLEEFESLVGLQQERGSASEQLAGFMGAVEAHFLTEPAPQALHFVSVSPGSQHRFSPFVAVEFDLNLTGRFYALPRFLKQLSEIAQQQQCTVSVGVLQVQSSQRTAYTGELSITLPLRAYFRE